MGPLHYRSVLRSSKSLRPNGADLRRRIQFSLAKICPGFVHRSKERWPIFKVGGEDLLHHHPRKLWHEMVQHYGRISSFIGQTSPEQIGRIPGFRKETAGNGRERWHGRDIKQVEAILLGHAGMGSGK